jgi:hypothetical protein
VTSCVTEWFRAEAPSPQGVEPGTTPLLFGTGGWSQR